MRIICALVCTAIHASSASATLDHADVWPSREAACRATVQRLASYLDNLTGLTKRQVDVREGDRTDGTRASVMLVEQMLQERGFKALRGVAVPQVEDNEALGAVSIAVSEAETDDGGSVVCQVLVPPGPAFAARYVPKPWVEDEKAYGDEFPDAWLFVGQSGTCGNRAEAERTAKVAAREKLRHRLTDLVRPDTGEKLGKRAQTVLAFRLERFLETEGHASDLFMQTLGKTYGEVYRCWALLRVPEAELDALARRVSKRIQWHWLTRVLRIAVLGALALAFRRMAVSLNAATNGLFEARVNAASLAATVLGAAVIFWA